MAPFILDNEQVTDSQTPGTNDLEEWIAHSLQTTIRNCTFVEHEVSEKFYAEIRKEFNYMHNNEVTEGEK